MTCDRYRPLLALLVGNDLDPREGAEVRQHLSDCASCQAQWEALQAAVGALQLVSRNTVVADKGSLLAPVMRRLKSRPVIVEESVPGWLTLGAFSAACAAVLWLTVSTPVFDFDLRDSQFAELSAEQFPADRAIVSPAPQLQLVGDAQPAIPIQFTPEGIDFQAGQMQSGQMQVAPRLFGGPRSF